MHVYTRQSTSRSYRFSDMLLFQIMLSNNAEHDCAAVLYLLSCCTAKTFDTTQRSVMI